MVSPLELTPTRIRNFVYSPARSASYLVTSYELDSIFKPEGISWFTVHEDCEDLMEASHRDVIHIN